ncbi:MAG: hypothetical protein R2911_07375 [Caldilineaceae bacterium]
MRAVVPLLDYRPEVAGQCDDQTRRRADQRLPANGADDGFAYIGRLVALLIVLYVISMAFSYAQSFIMATVSMEVTYDLRKEIDLEIEPPAAQVLRWHHPRRRPFPYYE